MNQFGCPHAKDPNSNKAGTGGPKGGTEFQGCDGKTYKRNADGGIPDECTQKISNAAGTLSMANTGQPGTYHNSLLVVGRLECSRWTAASVQIELTLFLTN